MRKTKLNKFIKLLKKELPYLTVKTNQKFSNYTTFKIGGKMGAFVEVCDRHTLIILLRLIRQNNIDYFILGNGSNLLVSDKKINKFVIKIMLKNMFVDNETLICDAGVNMYALGNFACNNNLSNLEWSYGIPGTVGGAIKMNAGCFGSQMADVVQYVYFTDGQKIYRKSASELEFGYRHSFFSDKNFVILRAVLKLKQAKKDEIFAKMQTILKKRKDSQPYNYPSAGSVFKRINGTPVPILIEQCNLKGLMRGGAQISTKHCGFIINYNNRAKFKDVFYLFLKIKKTIYKKFGIIIQEEIEILK